MSSTMKQIDPEITRVEEQVAYDLLGGQVLPRVCTASGRLTTCFRARHTDRWVIFVLCQLCRFFYRIDTPAAGDVVESCPDPECQVTECAALLRGGEVLCTGCKAFICTERALTSLYGILINGDAYCQECAKWHG